MVIKVITETKSFTIPSISHHKVKTSKESRHTLIPAEN